MSLHRHPVAKAKVTSSAIGHTPGHVERTLDKLRLLLAANYPLTAKYPSLIGLPSRDNRYDRHFANNPNGRVPQASFKAAVVRPCTRQTVKLCRFSWLVD